MLDMNANYLTIKKTVEMASVSRHTIHRDIKSGKLPVVYLGRNVRIKESDAIEYAKEKGHSKRVAYYKKKKEEE